MKPVRAAPLFVQVLGLVIVSLIAAHAVSLFIIFSLPPPPPEAYRLSEVAEALRAPGVTEVMESRPLVASLRERPPPRRYVGRRSAEFRNELARRLDVPPARVIVASDVPYRRAVRMRAAHPPEAALPLPPPLRMTEPIIFAPFRAAVRQDDGRWLTAQPRASFRWASWQGRIILTLLVSIVLIAPLAWWFARRLASPIAAFAGAAERLGRDPRAPPLELEGSGEVRAAVTAFNNMQERLRRYVEDRTAMVGAIAHDLRTPLTRLRFRIEGAPDDLRAKLSADIDQMEAMVAAALGFVRDATNTGQRTRLELASLAESIFDEAAETGADATVETDDRIIVDGDPLALRRMISNLLENAVKYGGRARGRVFAKDGQAVIEIDDDGPGIPAGEMDRVFEPFFRGEPSRSRETGGAGLGLAVVRSIARAHGGDIELINREGGGLTARVTLPT